MSASRSSASSAGLARSRAPREPGTYPEAELIDLDPLGLRAADAAWA